MKLPEHKCGLYLTHNEHKNVYETAEQAIIEREGRGEAIDLADLPVETCEL